MGALTAVMGTAGGWDVHRQEQEVSIAGHTELAHLPSEEYLIVEIPKGRKAVKG